MKQRMWTLVACCGSALMRAVVVAAQACAICGVEWGLGRIAWAVFENGQGWRAVVGAVFFLVFTTMLFGLIIWLKISSSRRKRREAEPPVRARENVWFSI